MQKETTKSAIFCLLLILHLNGCSLAKRIVITHEYIINENWNEQANYIQINKMNLKKDNVLDLSNINQVDLQNKLEEYSSWIYYANVIIKDSESYKTKRVYFNKDNGFYWKTNLYEKGTLKTIGNLEAGTWYKFSGLVTYPYFVYVYIDDQHVAHQFDANLSNF